MPYAPITEDEARLIVQTRIDQAQEPEGLQPMELFVQSLRRDGVLRRPYSVRTIQNILNGQTYPSLKDRDGNAIDWLAIPRSTRGPRSGVRKAATKLVDHDVKFGHVFRRLHTLEAAAIRAGWDLSSD